MVNGRPIMGEIVLYQNANMRGAHRHVFTEEPDLRNVDDPTFNDAVSSFVILRGIWKLYRDTNFNNAYDGEYGPGAYEKTDNYGVKNDDMSSLKCIRPA